VGEAIVKGDGLLADVVGHQTHSFSFVLTGA
jgi:hypothetical protein